MTRIGARCVDRQSGNVLGRAARPLASPPPVWHDRPEGATSAPKWECRPAVPAASLPTALDRPSPVLGAAPEAPVLPDRAGRFVADAAAPSEFAFRFAAGGLLAPAGALRVRPRRGGRPGSWRSRPSLTSRPTSCPSVMCGSTWESSPLSCSSPRWQSASMTALSSQRPSPSGRSRSAGTASAGSTSASIFVTSRVLLPAACSTSAFCADTSSTGPGFGSGAGFRWADRAGAGRAEPFDPIADPVPAPAPRPRSRSRRSKAACNCAAASSVSEPSQSRSRTPSILVHSFMALIRRHVAASL